MRNSIPIPKQNHTLKKIKLHILNLALTETVIIRTIIERYLYDGVNQLTQQLYQD